MTGTSAYYAAAASRPPHDSLLEALRLAVDLGCGQGRDTVELMRHGWRVVASLPRGGRFAGTLFGDHDDWARPGGHSRTFGPSVHHTRAEVDALLAPFDVEWLHEQDEDTTTTVGTPKHWRDYRIVARKR